jgi:beta-lactam-binding protein with PASTA domain
LRFSQRNLRLGNLSYVTVDGKPGIISAEPPVDSIVPAQTPVSLLVGVPEPAAAWVMPDVIDRSIDAVRYALEGSGLTIANVRYESYPGIQDGVIIRQYPLGGSPVSSSDPITLVVTRQDEPGLAGQPEPSP